MYDDGDVRSHSFNDPEEVWALVKPEDEEVGNDGEGEAQAAPRRSSRERGPPPDHRVPVSFTNGRPKAKETFGGGRPRFLTRL